MSVWKVWTHFAMRTWASFFMSSSMCALLETWLFERDRCPDVLTLHDARQVTRIVEIEHPQRQAVVPAHDDRGRIHHVQLVGEDPVEGQRGKADGGRIPHRIVGIDTVHLGRLQEHVGVDFDRTQRRRRIGGEEGIAGAGGEYHHPPFLEMTHSPPADVVLADLVDTNGRHDARVHSQSLERVLHGKRIHDGGQHAHVIGRDAIHSRPGEPGAAKDVATADDHGGLHAHRNDLLQFPGNTLEYGRVHAVVGGAEQRLTGQLDEDSGEARFGCVVHRYLTSSATGELLKKTPREAGFSARASGARLRYPHTLSG